MRPSEYLRASPDVLGITLLKRGRIQPVCSRRSSYPKGFMRSSRRVTQRVVPALASVASVLLFATCDFDKISGTPTPITQEDIDRLFSITPTDTTIILGGTTTLSIAPGANVDLSGTTKTFSSSQPTVVAIDSETGVATGLTIGNATITARVIAPELDSGYSKTRALRVRYKGIKACGVAPLCSPNAIDSIAGLNLSRPFSFFGTNNSDARQSTPLTGVTITTRDSGATTNTVASVTGSNVFARKNGAAYVIGVFESMRDSIKVRVRQVAKSLTFPTTDYTARSLNVDRAHPVTIRDVNDSIMTSSPRLRWRSSDTTVFTIDSITGILRVKKKDTARIFVSVDTVLNRNQKLIVDQALASLTKFSGDNQTDTVALVAGLSPTVTAVDSGNAPIAGLTVTFRRGLGFNAEIADSVQITNSSGRATLGSWKLGDSVGVGINTVIASAGSSTVTFSATTVAGAPKRLAFVGNVNSAATNTTIAPAITVQIQDSLGNPASTATNPVTLSISNNSGGAVLGGTVTVNAVAGVATFNNIQLDAIGSSYTLQASSGVLQSAISNGFDIFGAATKLGFATQPSAATANVIMQPVRVAIQDAAGSRVTTATDSVFLAIGTNAGGGTLGGTLRVRAVDGLATFNNLTLSAQGNGYTLNATALGLTASTSNTFNVAGVGPAAKLAFAQQPTNVVASTSIAPAITVQVQDANGQLVTTSNQQITLTIESSSPTGASLGGTVTQNAVNGVATFTNISINKAANGYKLLATGTGSTLVTATSSAFNVSAGTANKLAFFQPPTHTVAGQNINPGVVVEVQDAVGNRVTSGAYSVSLTLGGCTSTLSGNAPQTTSAGVTTFSVLSVSTVVSNCTLSAAATGLTSAVSSTFNSVSATGSPMKLAFTASPSSSVSAGQQLNATGIRVAIQDAAGTTVTSSSIQVTLTIESNPGGSTITNGSAVSAFASSGVATFTNVFLDKIGSGYTIKASATGYASIISSSFNVTAAAASRLGFLTQPTTVTGGTPFNPTLQVAVQDQYGNTVTSATNSITLGISHPSLSIPFSTGNNLVVSAVNGVATYPGATINKAAAGARIFANATNLTGALSNAFDIQIGPLAGLGFSTQPSNVTAGNVISPSVVVQAQDAAGNTITDFASPITLALTGGTVGAVLSGTKTITPASGVATFTNLSIDKANTGYQLTASASGVSNGVSNAFVVAAGAASKLTWLDNPTNTFLNAPLSTTAQQPRIAVQDALGNTVLTNNFANIRLQIVAGPSVNFKSPTSASTTFADFTVTNGILTVPTGVQMLTAGIGYQFSAAALNMGLTGANSTAFNVGAFDVKAKLGFKVQPSNTTYNVAISPAVQVAVQDAYGNTVTSANDQITITKGSDPNGNTVLSGGAGTAAVSGIATFSSLTLDKGGSPFTLEATANGLTAATSGTFSVSGPPATWQALASMPTARNHVGGAVINGIVYVAGGFNGGDQSSLYAYDPVANSWSTKASMPGGRYQSSGVASYNNELYYFGGWTTSPGLPNNNTYIYNPTTNTWRSGANMPTLSGCGAAGAIGTKIYVTTACDGNSGYRNFLRAYDPAANSWTPLANSSVGHSNAAYAVIDGKLYVAGGVNDGGYTNVLEVYDPVANSWSTKASLPTPREAAFGAVLNGKFYVIGGTNASGNQNVVEVYDPATNSWSTATVPTVGRHGAAGGVVANVLYLAGGATPTVVGTLEKFTP